MQFANAGEKGVCVRVCCASESRLRLENRRGVKVSEGSNPSLSATNTNALALSVVTGPDSDHPWRDIRIVDLNYA